ncbi:MAG: type IV toxin-antitoxin system AbiEi family antitoxin domain-containing protein [Candidatus Woesearchaeota archaeon]
MKKSINQITNYGLSKSELSLINEIKENELITFSTNDLKRLLNWDKTKVNNILSQLKKKNQIINIKRDTYCLKNVNTKFEIATEVINPSYISFWTALNYYGITDQQVNKIQLITTRQFKDIEKFNISITKFKPYRFFGYKKVDNFNIAELEKCLIDSLAYPNKSGGFKEVVNFTKNSWKQINKKKFLSYLKKYNNKSLNARMGYILKKLNLAQIKIPLPTTYVKLNKDNKITNKKNKEWRIIINDDI